jgi:hypothetical protein
MFINIPGEQYLWILWYPLQLRRRTKRAKRRRRRSCTASIHVLATADFLLSVPKGFVEREMKTVRTPQPSSPHPSMVPVKCDFVYFRIDTGVNDTRYSINIKQNIYGTWIFYNLCLLAWIEWGFGLHHASSNMSQNPPSTRHRHAPTNFAIERVNPTDKRGWSPRVFSIGHGAKKCSFDRTAIVTREEDYMP